MQAASVRPTGLSRPTALSAPPTRRGATTRALPVAPPNSGPPPAWPRHVPLPPADVKKDGPKKLSLLGSTGSIGTQTLDIVAEHPEEFEVVSLSAGSNAALLADQICSFRPSLVSVRDGAAAAALRAELEQRSELERRAWPEIQHGEAGICAVAAHPLADACVTGIVGCAGLKPTMAAIVAGKDICLANKETLIAGAPAVLPAAAAAGVKILPADSEHSALFQCLQGVPEGGLRRLLLTASGGAFRDWSAEDLKRAGVQDALKHPNWAMGKKITIDSATLMNKGLEVIEAHYLFGVSYDDIEIVIHPQSIIHSLVELADSSVLAQFGWPDMRLPILYTMSWPRRVGVRDATWPRLDLVKAGNLTFATPDHAKYPSMALAYAAGRAGGTMTGVMSAANERAVELFLEEKIGYLDLMHVVEAVCEDHVADLKTKPHLDDILAADAWARARASERAASLGKTVAV